MVKALAARRALELVWYIGIDRIILEGNWEILGQTLKIGVRPLSLSNWSSHNWYFVPCLTFYSFKVLGKVSVQWIFLLDTIRFGHVSKIQRVQWKNSLDTSLVLKFFHGRIYCKKVVNSLTSKGSHSCLQVGFVSCQIMSTRLYRLTQIRHV